MKKIMICTLFLAATGQVVHAKIWRVNNTSGVSSDFTTPQAAETAASAGDTIQIEGSGSGYGSATCTKKLIWIGPGYFLQRNPETQYNPDSASGVSLTFASGSDGSMVMGLNGPSITIEANNITVMRNQNPSITLGALNSNVDTGTVIEQNYGCYIYNYSNYSTFKGLQISANYINTIYLQNIATVATVFSNVIPAISYINGCLMEDNIIGSDTAGFGANNVFMYNILNNGTNTSPSGATDYNFYVSDFTTVFVQYNNRNVWDGNLVLSPASPAKGAGHSGNDLGMFGTGTPYILSGMPPVPSVYGLTGPNIVAGGSSSMPMTISIKSHN